MIDSCEGQNRRTIFDSIETLEPCSVVTFVVAVTEEATHTDVEEVARPPATRLTPRRFIIFVPRL